MGSPCRACHERPAVSRCVCRRCSWAIHCGRIPDVRSPSERGPRTVAIRSKEATDARLAYTLSRYPHLRRS